jgi:hypothetical protein
VTAATVGKETPPGRKTPQWVVRSGGVVIATTRTKKEAEALAAAANRPQPVLDPRRRKTTWP